MGLCVGRGVGCARCSGGRTADSITQRNSGCTGWRRELLAALLKTVTKHLRPWLPEGPQGCCLTGTTQSALSFLLHAMPRCLPYYYFQETLVLW